MDESWKGVSGRTTVVYGQDTTYYGELEEDEMYTSNSCTFPFKKGERYLVYANRYEDGFEVGTCSGTSLLADAEEDVRVLGPPSERLTDTGGPPLLFAGTLLAAVAFLISARTLLRWVNP